MSITWTTGLQSTWCPGLNAVSGVPRTVGLRAWLAKGNYQIYSAPTSTLTELDYVAGHDLLVGLANEVNRFTQAMLESFQSLSIVQGLPKSAGWRVIKTYYSAFYAAHAILRMTGQSLLNLDGPSKTVLNRLTTAFGYTPVVVNGFYHATLKPSDKKLELKKVSLNQGGSHEAMWSQFASWVRNASTHVLSNRTIPAIEAQQIASGLIALEGALRSENSNGAWLSRVRNRVTYRQEMGVWYPYQRSTGALNLSIPMGLAAPAIEARQLATTKEPLMLFYRACRTIVALCLEFCHEMAGRCQNGRSFHDFGILALEAIISGHAKTRSGLAG